MRYLIPRKGKTAFMTPDTDEVVDGCLKGCASGCGTATGIGLGVLLALFIIKHVMPWL